MNILKIVAIIAVVIAIAVVAIYLFSQFEQTRFISDGANNLVNTVTKTATDNPAIAATVTSGGIAAVSGAVLSKFNGVKDSATQKLTETQTAANSAIDSVKAEKNAALRQVEEAKTKLTEATSQVTDTQKQFDDYKKEIEPKLNEIKNLEGQVQSAKDENAQFVMNLMSAANGALVTNPVDGKVYSVLKTPPEIIVK